MQGFPVFPWHEEGGGVATVMGDDDDVYDDDYDDTRKTVEGSLVWLVLIYITDMK